MSLIMINKIHSCNTFFPNLQFQSNQKENFIQAQTEGQCINYLISVIQHPHGHQKQRPNSCHTSEESEETLKVNAKRVGKSLIIKSGEAQIKPSIWLI